MSRDTSLTVGQVAAAAGIAPSAVRYYESIGLLPVAERVGGWRRFPRSVLQRLALIRVATKAGFRLTEVGVLLAAVDRGEPGTRALAGLAVAKLPALEATLERTQLLLELMRAATECDCPTVSDCAARAEAAGVD